MARPRAVLMAAFAVVLMALPASAGTAAGKIDRLILKRNYPEALRLLKQSAAAGDAEAEYRLGGMYRMGLGVKPDRSKAVSFFKASRRHGYAKAEIALERLNSLEPSQTILKTPPWKEAQRILPSVRSGAPDAAGNPWLISAAARDLLKALSPNALKGATKLRARNGDDALAAAIRGSRPAAIAELLAAGVKADQAAQPHDTHLALAAAHATPAIIDLLTAAGANPGPALRQAASRCNLANTQALLRAGVELAPGELSSPLIVAVQACSDTRVIEALAAISPIDERDAAGRTALWYAAHNGTESAIALLIAHGATLSIADAEGQTPLHAAALAAKPDALSALLAQGADPSALTLNGDTPLILAAAAGCAPCIERLPASAGLIDARNARGETALLLATSAGAPDAVALLLKRGADAALRDIRRETAASVANRTGNAQIVSLLEAQ